MRKEISIPMPRRLCKDELYKPSSKQYCAVGYLLHHVCGVPANRLIGGYYYVPDESIKKIHRLLPQSEILWSAMVRKNNQASTQKLRIASFKKFCEKLGVKLIAR